MRRTLGAQLDVTRAEEKALFDYASQLKRKRIWASTFRDAIRLIKDLRAGNLDVLAELFPHVIEAAANHSVGGSGFGFVQRPALPAPSSDDDIFNTLEVKAVSDGDGQSAQNFINSLRSLSGSNSLPVGPKKLDAPAVLPPPSDVDDDELLVLVQ